MNDWKSNHFVIEIVKVTRNGLKHIPWDSLQ